MKIWIKWIVNDTVAFSQDAKLFFLYVWICIFPQMGLNKSVYLLVELQKFKFCISLEDVQKRGAVI